MNFLLSDEQLEMQNAVLRFAAEQCDSARLHRIFDSESGHDAELWQGERRWARRTGACFGRDDGVG